MNGIHRTIACAALLVVTATKPSPALAGHGPEHAFYFLSISGHTATYALLDTITHVVPETGVVWVLDVHAQPKRLGPWVYDYELAQDEFDCVHQRTRMTYLSLYRMGFKHVVSHEYAADEEYLPLNPGTSGWDEYQLACGRTKLRSVTLEHSKFTDDEAIHARDLLRREFPRFGN